MLIVDDDDRFRERLGLALERRGAEVHSAATSLAATALQAEHHPAAAVVDLRMPGGSGLELVSALVAADPALRVVVLTAYGSVATALEALRRGAVDYLQKPAEADVILAALRGERQRPGSTREIPTLARAEWEYIQRVLHDSGGSIRKAAKLLGLDRRTLQRKLAKYPVDQ